MSFFDKVRNLQSSDKSPAPEICLDYLDGNCSQADCNDTHTTKTFLWQFKESENWQDVADNINTQLETAFCNKNCDQFIITNDRFKKADFKSETITDKNSKTLPLRRCATPSSRMSFHASATKYQWYFNDERNQWIEYGKTNPNIRMRSATMTTSDDLEDAYCQKKNSLITASKKHSYRIEFPDMIQVNLGTGATRKILRRPLGNHATDTHDSYNRNDLPADVSHEWVFINERGRAIKYGEADDKQTENFATSTTSEDIERLFLADDTQSIRISSGRNTYILDFKARTQTNCETHKVRNIERRPIIDFGRAQGSSRGSVSGRGRRGGRRNGPNKRNQLSLEFPSYWTEMNEEDIYTKIHLLPHDPKYKEIMSLVKQTLNISNIVSLERIQNPYLWKDYVNKREYMEKMSPSTLLREEYLFHGTHIQHEDSICVKNLDWRRHGTNRGQLYGRGTYFSNEASYCQTYCTSKPRCLFIVKVIIGRIAPGNQTIVTPPTDSDTTVDNVLRPKIFVKYHDQQYYPEYILKYK